MRISNIFTIALLLFAGVNASARSFYHSQMKITIHYSQLEKDTKVLSENFTLNVRYSDDHDFCRIYVGKKGFTCRTYHPVNMPERATITINREEIGALVAEVIDFENCSHAVVDDWQRLSTYLSDTVDLEYLGMNFYQQVHDREPVSFHLWLYDLTYGKRY